MDLILETSYFGEEEEGNMTRESEFTSEFFRPNAPR